MGFEEVAHTADWSVRVWAGDLPALFAECARAMNALSGVVPAPGPRVKRRFETEGPDYESLLIAFLSELVYYHEQENLAFDRMNVETFERSNVRILTVDMDGAQISSIDKAIKAVTWHNLKIEKTARGLEVEIVFDV